MNSGIYKITNLISGKILIGQTINFTKRWAEYKCVLNKNKYKNSHLQRSWNKYGGQNFKFEVIVTCPIEKLDLEEIRLIKELHTMDQKIGYNLKDGGNRPTFSKEARERMSLAQTGKQRSKETRKRISNGLKLFCKNNRHKQRYTIARHLSETTRAKIRYSKLGNVLSEETKNKIRNSMMGNKNGIKYHTPERGVVVA